MPYLQIFDKNLTYIKTMAFNAHISNISSNNSSVMVSFVDQLNPNLLYRGTLALDTLESVEIELFSNKPQVSTGLLIEHLSNGDYLVASRHKNQIWHYNRTGSLVNKIILPGLPAESTFRNGLPENLIIRSLTYSEVGQTLYVLDGYNTEKGKQIIYAINIYDTNSIKSFYLPVLSHTIRTRNGYLYASSDQGSDIVRFILNDII
ncbi:MAG: hypothetical protein LAT57_05645 [Balneolales bacterium]|nr:hypothetical protein [Balneolales bacterium]